MSESDAAAAPNPRYRGLRPNPGTLGVTLLSADEDTRTMRVRATADVIAWAAALTAAERGVIFAQVYAQHHAPTAAPLPADAPASAHEGNTPPPTSEGPSWPAEGQAQRAVLGKVPDDLRAHHTWIVQALEQGGTLTRTSGASWRVDGGGASRSTVRQKTIELLTREGVLIVQN